MGSSNLRTLLSLGVLCTCLGSMSTTVYAQEEADSGFSARALELLASDLYRFSMGGSGVKLKNPNGFDVSSNTYDTGDAESDGSFFGTFHWTLTGESRIGWEGRHKRLWYLNFDSDNFEGLELQNLMLGAGFAVDPAEGFSLGVRLAGGVGTGLTRSSTYFDSAAHLSFEVWISAGIQLGRFILDASVRERKSLGASLDDRKASPATQINMLSLGWVF